MSMDFDLSPEQSKRREGLLAAIGESLPGRRREAPCDHFDRQDWQAAASLGLTGLCVPESHGGAGLGALDTALCLETFGQGCTDTGLVFGIAAHLLACVVPIRDFGSHQVHNAMLADIASGRLIAANAMTEYVAGSDIGAISMTAKKDGNVYVLEGVKSFASNSPLADVLVTYAVTDPTLGFLGLSCFALPSDLPGIEISDPFPKMGLWGCPAGTVRFAGCCVPERYLVGREGQGSLIFQHSMAWERACLFALYLGLMERQIEECVQHARSRRQFGHAIGDFQAISHRIADMRGRLESSRLLLYRACWLIDQGRDHLTAVALSKVAVSEAAVANSLDAVQILGGSGYLSSSGIEGQLRDSIPARIFSGTTEIQKELIAREAGL
jgi:L-prolyl-PCP dehydrogenase